MTSPVGSGRGVEYWDECVCLSVGLCVCLRVSHTSGHFTRFSMYVACGCGLVLLRWRCITLCTSVIVDDVMLSNNRPNGGVTQPQQRRCNVLSGLTTPDA